MGKKRGPLAATDKRRQAGHKRPKSVSRDDAESREVNGAGKHLAHLFNDRRKGKHGTNAEGKRLT